MEGRQAARQHPVNNERRPEREGESWPAGWMDGYRAWQLARFHVALSLYIRLGGEAKWGKISIDQRIRAPP